MPLANRFLLVRNCFMSLSSAGIGRSGFTRRCDVIKPHDKNTQNYENHSKRGEADNGHQKTCWNDIRVQAQQREETGIINSHNCQKNAMR